MIKNIACVGILVADIIADGFESLPQNGVLSRLKGTPIHNGGNAMTAAINLNKMGVNSKIIGKIGNDIYGKYLKECLINQNIDTRGLKIDENAQTSVSIVLLSPDGERTFLHCTGSNGTFSETDIDYNIINECDIVFVSGSFLLDTFDGAETAAFLKKCKEMGKTTFLDVCWDSQNRWDKIMDMVYPYIDFFMPSIDEAKMLCSGESEPNKIADAFMSKGVANTIIKLGSKGSFIKANGDKVGTYYPAIKGVTAVDTTGAGDSFCSGFLASYARGFDLDTCMKTATAAGGLCCSKKGATSGTKSYEETVKFWEDNY